MNPILCLDYGHVRIGVAISDASQTLASSREFINVKKGKIFAKIKTFIAENECESLVIGLPLSLNGQDTQKTVEVRRFAERLQEEIDIPVHLFDERLSSYEADSILIEQNMSREKRKLKRDSLAAQIILQDYLDSK